MTGPVRVYDPVPELARLLRVLGHGVPVGDPYPGSAHDLLRKIISGLGADGGETALELEKLLYGQLGVLPAWQPAPDPDPRWQQRFHTNMEGVIECPTCHMPMTDGVIAHKLDCKGMWDA